MTNTTALPHLLQQQAEKLRNSAPENMQLFLEVSDNDLNRMRDTADYRLEVYLTALAELAALQAVELQDPTLERMQHMLTLLTHYGADRSLLAETVETITRFLDHHKMTAQADMVWKKFHPFVTS